MKFGIRKPSLNKRIAARTSFKRVVRHSMGFKAPRGYGWLTNPKRAAYNRVYNRTTFKADGLILLAIGGVFMLLWAIIKGIISLFQTKTETLSSDGHIDAILCPRCTSNMVVRNGTRGKFYGCTRFPYCKGSRDLVDTDVEKSVASVKVFTDMDKSNPPT